MKIQCTITLEYKDSKTARTVLMSTKIDDMDFVDAKVHGKHITASITSSSVSSLLHTLDDYLACVTVAETIVE